jgi:hypothetical protein
VLPLGLRLREGDAVAHCDCDGERLVENVGDADTHADCDIDAVNVSVSEGDTDVHCDSDGDGVGATAASPCGAGSVGQLGLPLRG